MAASPARMTSGKPALFVGSTDSFPAEGFSRSPASKSPRSFDDRAVGLGIVAAMIDPGETETGQVARLPRPAGPVRSRPIPIVSAARPGTGYGGTREDDDVDQEEMELSESYTCVISHVGGKSVGKRVYFDDGVSDGVIRNYWENSGELCDLHVPSVDPLFPAADFLNHCHLCRKNLHGLDIFMYRGDKAFCSVECRCQQIASDENRENFGSSSLKPFDYSVSPCPTPLSFAAGIAAA